MKYSFLKLVKASIIIVFVSFVNVNLFAETNWSCFGAGIGEAFVPGLGYALNSQFDKAIVLGGSRWYFSGKQYRASEEEDYEDDPDKIYESEDAEDSESGKDETQIYLNRSTWDANYYGSLNFNLLLTTWGDLYQNDCKPNTQTYSYMLSPFRIDHFYDNWMFWLPILVAAGSYQPQRCSNYCHLQLLLRLLQGCENYFFVPPKSGKPKSGFFASPSFSAEKLLECIFARSARGTFWGTLFTGEN